MNKELALLLTALEHQKRCTENLIDIVNEKDTKTIDLEYKVDVANETIIGQKREIEQLKAQVKSREAESISYRNLYNDLKKVRDGETTRTKLLEGEISRLLSNISTRSDIFEAKASKANSEKLILLGIIQKMRKSANLSYYKVGDIMFNEYQSKLKQRREKKGGK